MIKYDKIKIGGEMNLLTNKKLNKILLSLGLMLGYILFELIYYFIGINFQRLTFNEYILLSFIKYAFFALLLIIIYRKYLILKWKDFRQNFKKYFSISSKDWFTGILIMFFTNIIINRFINGVGANEEAVQELISTAPFAAILMTSIFAPFNEEMIYRKSLQDCFKNKYLFMITAGLIFGFIHVMGAQNPYEYLLIIPYGALGFMFAHTISETDNIYCTIMMHMLHNLALTILAMVI